MVIISPVMDNYLYMPMTSIRDIKSLHRSFTVCEPSWFRIWALLDRGLAPTPLVHAIGTFHLCNQHYILALVLKV